MRKLFLCFLMLNSTFFFAQKEEIKIQKAEERLDALPYYDFRKGVGIIAPDSLFQMNIRFRMQNRFDAIVDNEDKLGYEAFIRRLRLRFDGFVKDPKLGYIIQLSFAPRDVNGNHIIRDAIAYYRPNKNWFFSFGQTKLPGNRQRINSSGALQLTDRSINNAEFNIDRDFGFQAHYMDKLNQFEYSIKSAITTGEGRDFIKRNTGLAYTARLELFPLGKFKKGGEYFEGDILREETPKLYLGATYHYNHNATKTQGQNGTDIGGTRNLQSVLVDALLKYNGWAVMGAYMQRSAKDPLIDISEKKYVVAGSGVDAQLSYAFTNDWEIASRYSFISPINELKDVMPKQKQFSLGVTKYIWEHAFKVQMEVARSVKTLVNDKKEWYVRFQVEMGI